MTEAKRPLKVFLCHAHDDKLKTRELYRYLRKRGIQPWLDAEDLVGGQDWRVEIPKAIRTSDAIIICLSKNSINKEGFVQAEITFALEKALEIPQGRIFIIPARFEDCDVPDNLERFHYVNLFEENGFPRLLKSLKTRANQLERTTVQIPSRGEVSPNFVLQSKAENPNDNSAVVDDQKNVQFAEEQIVGLPSEQPMGSALVTKPRRKLSAQVVALIGLTVIFIAALLSSPLIGKTNLPESEPTMTNSAAATLKSTETSSPTLTQTPSITPTSTPIFILPETGYTIVDPADVFKLVAKTDPFGKIAKEQYTPQEINSVDRTLFYTIDGTPDKPMQWRWYWCATTEEILKQNVNGIDVVFQADGRLIPHEQLAFTTYSYTKDTGGTGWCATFSTVIKDWKPGVYHFVIASTIKSVINDGEATFLPGFQISDFTVKIREPALKTEIVDDKGVQMALVLGSSFQMGGGAKVDQQPIHAVYLNSYYIDAYEVSNALYKACVDADACQPPKDISSTTHPSYYTDPRFKNYPVVNVNWSEAEAYCQWRDARLPTEAEWEKAARGVGGRTYPWGNLLECTYANYLDVGGTQCFVIGDTTPVDKYNKGVSPFGVYGLVGNVWEWVSDWYSENYYSVSPVGNPQGADSGQYRVMRGGSWKDDSKNMLPTLRNWYDPESYSNTIGFRCAKDVP